MGPMASQITSFAIVYSNVFIRAQIKENIKAPRHWPLCGEFTGDWWITRTNGQYRGKCFNLMTSSWVQLTNAQYHMVPISILWYKGSWPIQFKHTTETKQGRIRISYHPTHHHSHTDCRFVYISYFNYLESIYNTDMYMIINNEWSIR